MREFVDEISELLSYVADWGAMLIVPIPVAWVVERGARSRLASGGVTR